MNEFDIYTLGSGYYLEKIFNAIRLIIDGNNGSSFISIMKFSCIAAIVVLAIKAGINNDLKSASKWFLGVTIMVGLFLTSRAIVHIYDKLPDSYGITQAPRTVENVPWGLAFLGSTTSQVGNFLAEKFEMAFAGVFVNSTYQETGMLFGSKIIEDVSKLRIQDANLKAFVSKFYKRCVVPDLRTGYNRVNGYTIRDLVEAKDLLGFLKDHSSKARTIYFSKEIKVNDSDDKTKSQDDTTINDYISCNKAAGYIATALDNEITSRKPKLAKGFLSYFFPDRQEISTDQLFESILTNSYGLFIRESSKNAKDILLQNVMINAINDKVNNYNQAFNKVTTEETTESAYYSISQMAQKFVPIYRAALECILYGVFPLILILMVTPIGMEVLKNYSFGFIYLQMWQPMYAILFCIAGAWGKYYANGIDSVTFASHAKIASINSEISAIAGYMLASIPILSIFITRGMISSMGNLASSVFYVPQSAAVQNAEQAIRGNYQIGTTSIDTHSYNTTSGNKYDDNYAWMSGMKSFSMQSGAQEKLFADGRAGIDSSGAISNMAGLAKIDWNKAVGSRYDQSINEQMSKAERYSSSSIESASSGYSKLLGFDQSFGQGSNEYQNWNQNLSADQRNTIDEARSYVNRFAENHGISQQDAIKLAVAGNLSFGLGSKKGFSGLANLGLDATIGSTKEENFNKTLESVKDQKFAEYLSKIESFAMSSSNQEATSINNNMLNSSKTDFASARSANLEASKAMDKVHSIQESKGKFEQNSGNISQDLSNKFAEEESKKYGASGFEEIIRSNPEKTNELLNKFLDSNTQIKSNLNSEEFIAQKTKFNNDFHNSLKENHGQNLQSIEQSFENNKALVRETAPKEFEKNVVSKIEDSNKSKDSINNNLNLKTDQLNKRTAEVKNQGDSLQDKVIAKNKKSASKNMLDKLNPFNEE